MFRDRGVEDDIKDRRADDAKIHKDCSNINSEIDIRGCNGEIWGWSKLVQVSDHLTCRESRGDNGDIGYCALLSAFQKFMEHVDVHTAADQSNAEHEHKLRWKWDEILHRLQKPHGPECSLYCEKCSKTAELISKTNEEMSNTLRAKTKKKRRLT